MKIKTLIFTGIILLAIFLRFYKLGVNPPALDWDEASLGYNAYSLLKTGKDEFGRSWPISIRSFEDYKPALYTYLTIPSIYFLGLNEFSVRLPSALFGVLTVVCTYFLTKELFMKKEKLTLLCTFFLAISPWHLQFSRVAFESNIAVFFVVAGLACFFKGLNKSIWLVASSILLAISFYAYHSPRLVVPLIMFGYAVYYRHILWEKRIAVFMAIVLASILLIPFVREVFGEGRARLASVTVLTPQGTLDESIKLLETDIKYNDSWGKLLHNRRIIYFFEVAKGYLNHFNLDFLFLTGDAPDRHHARDMGMLYIWEAPFILVGILFLLKSKHRERFPVIWWYLIAPTASAITTGTPHAVRALLYLPTYQIFTALGMLATYSYLKSFMYQRIGNFIKVSVFVVIMINAIFYLDSYYTHTPIESAKDWLYGYKEAVMEIRKYEESVSKIIFTYAYDQPHVFVLFYDQIDPTYYQKQVEGVTVMRAERSFGKFEFRRIDLVKDSQLSNVLFVGTPNEIPEGEAGIVKNILFPDGSVAFRIVKR